MVACDESSQIEEEIQKIPVNLEIERFDKNIYEAGPQDLPQLKKAYPFLFPKSIPDSMWVKKLNDPLQKELLQEVTTTFSDFGDLEADITDLYKHLKYYKPQFQIPKLITLTNDVDYRNKIIVTDSLVLIALDNYLGADHRFYQNISRYLSADMKPEMVVSDLSEQYAQKFIRQKAPRTFLDEMIFQGKQLYFKDLMLPFKSDALKIGYSEEQLQWARENEASVWSYFIEKELLYSTDTKLNGRFINPAPYSKFYLEIDNESPGKIGVYMGWQIVRAYAETTGRSLEEIMNTPAEELFKQSKFKPRK
jgi:gliding motility-associated lipoprotein GldB